MMASVLPSLVVQRAIPLDLALKLQEGVARLYGGTVRDLSGRILGELVEASTLPGVPSIDVTASTLPTAAGLATQRVIRFALASTALSGLTLAVSTAGFVFLTKRLATFDDRLQQMQKDVKFIRSFLETRQRAELINALNTLRDVKDAKSPSTREQLLIDSRQELGTLSHHYAIQMQEGDDDAVFETAEEYFSLASLGHAHCTAELGMANTAANDYAQAFSSWTEAVTQYAKQHVLKDDPERFLGQRFAEIAGVEQIATWMKQFYGEPASSNWIDDLRKRPSAHTWWSAKPSAEDRNTVRLLDKLSARKQTMDGYTSQLRRLEERQLRPSEFQEAVGKLNPADSIENVFFIPEVQPEQKVLGA